MSSGILLPRSELILLLSVCAAAGCVKNEMADVLLPLQVTAEKQATSHATWASWRGGIRQGVSETHVAPLKWSVTEGVRWRVALPGRGNSSPVVWEDQIYLTSETDSQEVELFCFNRHDGHMLWRQLIGEMKGRSHRKNGFASATVATDGQQVYVRSGDSHLACFSNTGQRRWVTRLGHLEHPWGTASSPFVYNELVIQLCDSQSESSLVALNRWSGELVWRVERESDGSWSTPIVVQVSHAGTVRDELVINGTGAGDGSQGYVIGYDPANGSELWRVHGTSGVPCPTLVVADDLVISATGGNGPVLAIRPGGQGDVTDSRVVWSHAKGGAYVPTGVVVGANYFAISDGGVATCLDVQSGDVRWKKRMGGTFSASLTSAAGRIYAVSEQGEVHVFAADGEYRLLATNRMGESPCLATPAWVGSDMLMRTSKHLYCIGPQDSLAEVTVVRDSDDAPDSPSDGLPSRSDTPAPASQIPQLLRHEQ